MTNPDKDKLIAQFAEALTAATNASFDCAEFNWDECEDEGNDPTEEYNKLLNTSQKAKAKVLEMFKSALE